MPTVNLEATAKFQRYDIGMRISGPLEEMDLQLNSSPPLTKDQIVRMLTLQREATGSEGALDLMIGAGRESVLRKARELKAQGANCIALACTGMSTIRIAREIENSCGIPAVDPVMAEGLFAYYACLQSER